MGESTVRASLRLALEHMVEQGGGGYYQGPGSICEGLVGRFSDALDVIPNRNIELGAKPQQPLNKSYFGQF
jgi:hypothetical protein